MNIETVRRQHEERLMRLPNVAGVAIGEKAGKAVIKVLVTHKVPESALRPEEIVPREVDGFGTDVEEVGVIMAQAD